MLNHITLMGRLTRDPELRRTQSGTAIASVRLKNCSTCSNEAPQCARYARASANFRSHKTRSVSASTARACSKLPVPEVSSAV